MPIVLQTLIPDSFIVLFYY